MDNGMIQETPIREIKDSDNRLAQEVETERTMFGKVFSFGGNQFQGVTYSEPVHQMNRESGKWEEIDATFREAEDKRLIANAGTLNISCGESGEKAFVELEDDKKNTIAWGIEEANHVIPQMEKLPERTQERTISALRERPFERLHHQVTYEEIFPGVNMICCSGASFKEEFVFTAPETVRSITFRISASGELKEEKNGIVMLDLNGLIAFHLPAPYLVDAKGEIGKVAVSLLEDRLIYEPDHEFMASAEYPVMLDPTIQTGTESSAIVDTFVQENRTDDFSNIIQLWVTNSGSGYGNRNSYIKVNTLPSIGSNHFVTEAYLHLRPAVTQTFQNLLLAKEVLGSWNASTITYANQPSLNSLYQDSWLIPSNSTAWCEVDVTALARKWYAGMNYGLALVPQSGGNSTVRLHSMDSTMSTPYFSVNYSSLGGLEDYLSYDAQPVGRAGTGYVSLHNGNMIFAHSDTIMNGTRMPVSVTHYYNSCDADKNDLYMGKGWKTNLHQTLHKAYLNTKVYYIYTDGDGTQHYFESANSGNTEYKDMSGLELKLVPGNPTTITDKGDTVMSFPQITAVPTAAAPVTSRVLISKIQDAKGNQVTISSTGLKINSVTDGAGRTTYFDYSSNLCSCIRTPWQTASTGTRFTYSGTLLGTVTYEDSTSAHPKQTSFSYTTVDNFSLLASVTSPEGFVAYYIYTSTNALSGLPHYVSQALVLAGSQLVSNKSYTYGHLLTRVQDNISGKTLRFHFNENGNQISVDDELGYARYTKYDQTGENANAPINHATERSRMQKVVTNLLMDGMMNDNSSLWTTGGSGTFAQDYSVRQWGNYSQKITITSGNTAYKRQAVTLIPGKSYTLSGYVKSAAPKAFLRITYTMSGTTYNVDSDPVNVGSSAFERLAVSFTLPTNASTTVYCAMVCMTTAGNAWFDCIQLEEGLTLNHFNMLQNSTFTRVNGTLPTSWTSGYNSQFSFASYVALPSSVTSFLSGQALRVTGLYYANIDVYQQFRCNGSMGDRFSAGGWCCGYAKRNRSNNTAACRINVMFGQNTTYMVSGGTIEWNSTEGEWQFASTSIVAPMDYAYIKFAVEYVRQINYADFSNLFLYPEQFGAKYVYDAKGNSTAVTTLFGQSSGAQYDSFNNMTSYTAPGHTTASTFNYGATDAEKKKYLLLKSISPLGTVTVNTYDTYGNPTQTQVKDTDTTTAKFIQSNTTYTSNGNYVATQKDARAKTVTTVTDANKGTVTKVTDPNSQDVNYTYDTLRRVKTTTATANSKTYRNTYTYDADKDWLTQVKHNTTSDAASSSTDVEYNFTYDVQGRQTAVKVGTQTLCENEYDTNVNRYGTLKKVTYGNGQTVENEYDNFSRITGIRFNGETTPRYKYSYNANGQVAHVIDSELGRVQQSEYDLANRPCRVKLRENGSHVYTGEVEYDPVKGNLAKFTEKVGTGYTKYETTFGYDNEDRPTTLNYGSTSNQTSLTYDGLGRVTNRTVKVNGYSYGTAYSFSGGGYGSNSTTGLITGITQSGENFTYTYDNVGNIASVVQNSKTTRYTYDNLGQLIRVDDQNDTTSGSTGTTWTYEYDRGGNILNKKRYAYTTGTLGMVKATITYTYGASAWKDKLTSYNGSAISYDAIGNPTGDGTWTYTWEKGRQLKKMSKTGTTAEFKYNADGLRVQKKVTVSGTATTTNYILHGKNIVHMTRGSTALHFWYDAQNRPAIVLYGSTRYAYVHNLQGDIVGIIDNTGTEVVKYTYDAWGKVLSTTGSLASTLGTVQPFRYRGYVYDVETGLYYLRSRYYNPEWGRFINADTLMKGNLYRYCHNSPISRIDFSGNSDLISETSGNVTDFMREGFECLVCPFPRDESNWRTYIQKTKIYYYIPYQDFQYYRNCLDDSHYNGKDELLSIIDDEVTSLIDDVGTSFIKMLFPKILGSSIILSLIRDIEAYQKAVNDARVHEHMSDAHQKAVDNKSGVTVEITIIKKWIAIETLDWRHYAYYETPPMLEFDYSEGRNFPIDSF